MRRSSLLCIAIVAALVPASPAVAASDCVTPLPAIVPIATGQGSLESIAAAPDGRLYFTSTPRGALMRIARPGAPPEVVADGIVSPGGLAFDADPRFLFVGEGDNVPNGLQAPLAPAARLLRVDVVTGEKRVFAAGLGMANGVERHRDGTVFASNDVSVGLDRISPDGTVTRNFSPVLSGNGMAIDAAGERLFIAQTFVPAAVQVIDLADPSTPRDFARPGPEDMTAGLDGMDIDPQDRLAVTANLPGEVWRVGTDGAICVLGRGQANASDVAYGRGPAGTFEAGRLYAVGFGGQVSEIPAGFVAPAGGGAPSAASAALAAQRRARSVAQRRARRAAARARVQSRRSVRRRAR